MLDGRVQARHDGMAAWLVVTAPGMLLTRSVAAVALVTAACLSRLAVDPRLLGIVSVAYLGVQTLVGLWMVRRPGWGSVVLGGVSLAVDAAVAGVLLGDGPALRGVGLGVAVLAIGLAFEVDGWRGAFLSGCLVGAAAGAAVWHGGVHDEPAGPPFFSPALSVERSFPGLRIQSTRPAARATLLSVETGFADTQFSAGGVGPFSPVLSVERSFDDGMAIRPRAPFSLLAIPPLLIAVLALVAGNFVSLSRSRRMQTVSAYATAVARRLAV